jgi:hypothetical protein
LLIHTLIGSALVAGGAAALNQVLERGTDSLMRRTRWRPVPAGRISATEATVLGGALATLGLVELAAFTNVTAAAVAAVTLASYVLVYTPLKTRTSLSTLIGAVPGALPPVIGWTAATGTVSAGAAVLFGIVFLWQMPHFLAIAWMYRDDYERTRRPPHRAPGAALRRGALAGEPAARDRRPGWPDLQRRRDRSRLPLHRPHRPVRTGAFAGDGEAAVPVFDPLPHLTAGGARRQPDLVVTAAWRSRICRRSTQH